MPDPLFSFNPDNSLDPVQLQQGLKNMMAPKGGDPFEMNAKGGSRSSIVSNQLANQFLVFQFAEQEQSVTIHETSKMLPREEGSKDEPDVKMHIEMQAFHVAENEEIDKNTRATMRVVIGKDKNSTDQIFDNAFWTISAGLKLYDEIKNKRTEPKELNGNFRSAFGKRPIEIPGALAQLSFDVVMHEEPKWYERIFKFLQSPAGNTLTSVIGFPALTQTAVGMIDELLNRLDTNNPKVLFKSEPMTLALTQYAKDQYTGGNTRIQLGSLSPGFCILAKGKDYEKIAAQNAYFYPTYGKLIPENVAPEQFLNEGYEDPFRDVTYAVFKVGMKTTNLRDELNYY